MPAAGGAADRRRRRRSGGRISRREIEVIHRGRPGLHSTCRPGRPVLYADPMPNIYFFDIDNTLLDLLRAKFLNRRSTPSRPCIRRQDIRWSSPLPAAVTNTPSRSSIWSAELRHHLERRARIFAGEKEVFKSRAGPRCDLRPVRLDFSAGAPFPAPNHGGIGFVSADVPKTTTQT